MNNLRSQIQGLGAEGDLMLQTISKLAEAELFLLNRSSVKFEVSVSLFNHPNDTRKWVEVSVSIWQTGEVNLFQLYPFINEGCTVAFAGSYTFKKRYFYSHGD